jgi:fumarate hydratase subunit alpha
MTPENKKSNSWRRINAKRITATVKKLFITANTTLNADMICALRQAARKEESLIGKQVLKKILENADIAANDSMPICQDTGLAVLFVEVGQDVRIIGGDLRTAIQDGVKQAYQDGCLRKSLCDPLTRENTRDNTPAVIHLDIVPGNRLRLIAMPKGGGSENMSQARMLTPSAGLDGIKAFVLETVEKAGANPCPPIVVGVGIGGSLEEACLLAKKALLRPVGKKSKTDKRLSQMESDLIQKINETGIGPAGLGGRITTLAVHAEMMPCHIASLPVAVNIQCHVSRHSEETL